MKIWHISAALSILLSARAACGAEVLDVPVDKGRLLRLETNAKIVLVAEPAIADAVVESPRLIFILGRRPGETNLYILDAGGQIIHEADVVVHADLPRVVSVHRGSREATLSCAPRCASVPTPGQQRARRLATPSEGTLSTSGMSEGGATAPPSPMATEGSAPAAAKGSAPQPDTSLDR